MTPSGGTRTRLTRGGWAAVAGASAAILLAALTGVQELMIVGACLLLLVVGGWVALWVAGTDLDVERTIRPRRVTVGESCTVEVRVHNGRSVLRLPIELRDSLDGAVVNTVVLPQRRQDPACLATYELPARRRGVARFGPLAIDMVDPFGLVRSSTTVNHLVDVIMLPRLHALGIDGAGGADDPTGGVRHRRAMATVSEEFDSLREYVPGDDVRRVHWASTARFGRPLVRNHQPPAQRRTTVLLDDRMASYPPLLGPEPFERSVSAAASVLAACRDRGDLVRLVTASGIDTDYFDDRQRFDGTLDRLAALIAGPTGSLTVALRAGSGPRPGDRLVVCCGVLDVTDRAACAGAAAAGGDVVVISCTGDAASGASTRYLAVPFGADGDLDRWWQAAEQQSAPRVSAGGGSRT